MLENGAHGELSHLHIAIENGDNGVLRELLHHGADEFTKQCDDGHTTVWYALYYAISIYSYDFALSEESNLSSIQEIEKKKSCIKLLLEADAERESVLMLAIETDGQNKDMVSTLLNYGAKVNFCDESQNGLTPLMVAVECHQPGTSSKGILADLLAYGADINAKLSDGETALFIAARMGQFQALVWLIDNGADIYALNERNENFLEVLSYNSYIELLPEILGKGVYPSFINVDVIIKYTCETYDSFSPATPLSVALWKGKSELIRLLVEIGFLTGEDIRRLPHYNTTRRECPANHIEFNCPSSLELISFVKVSDLLGASPDRCTRVTQLGLPISYQEKLLFKRLQDRFKNVIAPYNKLEIKKPTKN